MVKQLVLRLFILTQEQCFICYEASDVFNVLTNDTFVFICKVFPRTKRNPLPPKNAQTTVKKRSASQELNLIEE